MPSKFVHLPSPSPMVISRTPVDLTAHSKLWHPQEESKTQRQENSHYQSHCCKCPRGRLDGSQGRARGGATAKVGSEQFLSSVVGAEGSRCLSQGGPWVHPSLSERREASSLGLYGYLVQNQVEAISLGRLELPMGQ